MNPDDTNAAAPVLTVQGAPSVFYVMAKPSGAVCNLDCKYCFFLSKEQLYRGSGFRMAEEVQEAYIRQLLEVHARAAEVEVSWQGGEPTLMGLDFFRRSIELERRYAKPGQRILNILQTNGTLLDDDWGRFLKENNFLVGISIDGPPHMHDAYRVDKGGRPTFARVISGLDVLKRHRVDWNVLTTVQAVNEDHGGAVYRFLRDELGATFIQFIPVVERATPETIETADAGRGNNSHAGRPLYTQRGSLVTHRSVDPGQFGRFMIDVFEEWVRRDIGTVYVQMFDSTLANFCGAACGVCFHAQTCGQQLVLEHNGDLYSCDHFVEPDYLLGNIMERHMLELANLPRQLGFGQNKRDALTACCRDCDLRFACNGGCPKDRFATSPSDEPGQQYLCPGYKVFFTHVRRPMEVMAQLIRKHRAPAELMNVYSAEDRRRPRNAPCTCGSGKKWKHCHGSHRSAGT